MISFTPRDPNNLRNRYRRAMAAHRAYGWRCAPFRDWVRGCHDRNSAYSAEPHHLNFEVFFLKILNVNWRSK